MNKILIIDDEPQIRGLLSRIVSLEGYQVFQAEDCRSALKCMEKERPDVVLCDVFLPDGHCVDFVREIRSRLPLSEVILLTAHGNIADGVQAIKNGAFDYITKGDDNARIIPLLGKAMEKSVQNAGMAAPSRANIPPATFDAILGESEAIKRAVDLARKVAPTDVPVLITGQTGTGKEVFAQAIHRASARAGKDIVAVNCSAFSKELLESEMFGYRAGAFTGAVKDKKGLFAQADGGTIFLDEIGEMAVELQAKLLRVLESGEYMVVGDTKPSRTDVRVIAATNRDLSREIAEGNFREDLYYRLSVFSIHLPALDERRRDIPLLVDYFVRQFSEKLSGRKIKPGADFLSALCAREWKGNIRELRNVVEHSIIVSSSDELQVEDLPVDMQAGSRDNQESELDMASVEKRHISKVLGYTGGNKTEAARLLKIGLTTLYRKMEQYGL